MKVSWKWLKELVEVSLSAEEIAEKLTHAGLEVEGIEYLQKGVSGVVVGKITNISPHPQADKLLVCNVDTGNAQWTIVTGAPNVQEGQIVPVALPGATLPGGIKIKESNLRGVNSAGMLCSAEELGLDVDKLTAEQKEGILILPADLSLGTDIIEVLGLDDVVLEIGLTPNRSDCLGMINIAREVATLTGGKLKLPQPPESKAGGEAEKMTKIEIEEPELCKRFTARILKDVQIKPSPLWMQQRLMAAGIRPINNIVDVTNYVMMEMGQPMHAYDYDKLKERRIVVRKPRQGEELTTLDGQARALNSEMIVIADGQGPVGLAGVMGGLETEVTDETKNILLESAHFNPVITRRTAQALAMRSEASLRFEKNVDIEQTKLANDRAIQLLVELKAGTPVEGYVECYPQPAEKKTVLVRLEQINKLLGTSLSAAEVEDIFHSLQIEICEKKADSWLLSPPSYRGDLAIEADFIEEVARLHGYNNIPTTLPQGDSTQGKRTWEQQIRHKLGHILTAQGLDEIITYSFINPHHLDWLDVPADHNMRDAVVVQNPLSEEQGIMRTTLLPGILESLGRNINKRNKNLRLFELGKIYFADGYPEKKALPTEKMVLGLAVTGGQEKSWVYPEINYDFYYLKGILDTSLASLGITDYSYEKIQDVNWLHPGRSARLLIEGQEVGLVGEIHPLVLENYEIDQRVTACQLDVEILIQKAVRTPVYKALPRFPALSRDLAIVVPVAVEAAAVEEVIRRVGQGLLSQIRLFDLYQGQQVKEGFKSLAYSLSWQDKERTLTDEEINDLHRKIEETLNTELGADIRR